MVQIVRSASCFRPRVRHLPLRIQHRRPVGTVICRFSEWCSAHLFVLPAIAKGLHVARLPFALENLSARCQADRPYQASCHKHRLPFAGKRHFLFALTNDYVFNFNRHLQPLIITVILYSIFLFSWEINISNKDTRKRFRLYCARN